jgi:hypothetical protein
LNYNSPQSQEIKGPQSQRPVYRLLASYQTTPSQTAPSQIASSQIASSQITPSQTAPSQIASSQITPSQIVNEEFHLPSTSAGLKRRGRPFFFIVKIQ